MAKAKGPPPAGRAWACDAPVEYELLESLAGPGCVSAVYGSLVERASRRKGVACGAIWPAVHSELEDVCAPEPSVHM